MIKWIGKHIWDFVSLFRNSVVIETANKIYFHDDGGGENITASADGHLEINSGTTLDMTSPTIDVNASTKVILDTPDVEFTGDNTDHTISKHDGTEVARIHDGGSTQPTNMTAVGPGFGFKHPVMNVTASGGNVAVTLTAAQSGSIILCDAAANKVEFALPVIDSPAKVGIFYIMVAKTTIASGKWIQALCSTKGDDSDDKFLMHGFDDATSISDITGDTVRMVAGSTLGGYMKITCISDGASSAAEIWAVEAKASTVTLVA